MNVRALRPPAVAAAAVLLPALFGIALSGAAASSPPAPVVVAAATPTPAPLNRSTTVVERQAMFGAMRTRFGKPAVQTFAPAGTLVPAPHSRDVRTVQAISAMKAAADYQKACDAGDPSTPPRIDRILEPVAPGAVVQITGDCFGKTPGSVTLAGTGPSTVRLTVQSWSPTAIAAAVPGIADAHRQTVVIAVYRAATGSAAIRNSAAAAALGVNTSGNSKLSERIVTATQTGPLPAYEAAVDFWPQLERHTVAAEALSNRSCPFPVCITGGTYGDYLPICTGPCADHEAQSNVPSGVRSDGWHWLHSGDDVWVVRHPVDWQIQAVNFDFTIGTVSAQPPQEFNTGQSVLTIHWQDIHNVYNDEERGLWFFATYQFNVTLIGPKGTWPA